MPLLSLWGSNRTAVAQLSIEQIVATAGDGRLTDQSTCSTELRQYLTEVSSEQLGMYAEHCLAHPFGKSGYVLQDIVNELGRRLDYSVQNGRYQGTPGGIGYDGLWKSPESKDLLIEVKTTDAYRIPLETIATYRRKLHESGVFDPGASVLIVVGREDTGELEAQVRGSRYAWDMRLISVDALRTLVALKESTEAGVTGAKIRSILVPMEFTRLDSLVDVMFAAAKDVEATLEVQEPGGDSGEDSKEPVTSGWQFTDSAVLQAKREEIVNAIATLAGKPLVKRTRATYWDSAHSFRVACTVSKRYMSRSYTPYWYAYHPQWNEYLSGGEEGRLVLGCMDLTLAFSIPVGIIKEHLPELLTSRKDDGSEYWHLKIVEPTAGDYALQLPRIGGMMDLMPFQVQISP